MFSCIDCRGRRIKHGGSANFRGSLKIGLAQVALKYGGSRKDIVGGEIAAQGTANYCGSKESTAGSGKIAISRTKCRPRVFSIFIFVH